MAEKIKTPKLRTPMYELSDSICGIRETSKEMDDEKLTKLTDDLDKLFTKIHAHVSKKYIWD